MADGLVVWHRATAAAAFGIQGGVAFIVVVLASTDIGLKSNWISDWNSGTFGIDSDYADQAPLRTGPAAYPYV